MLKGGEKVPLLLHLSRSWLLFRLIKLQNTKVYGMCSGPSRQQLTLTFAKQQRHDATQWFIWIRSRGQQWFKDSRISRIKVMGIIPPSFCSLRDTRAQVVSPWAKTEGDNRTTTEPQRHCWSSNAQDVSPTDNVTSRIFGPTMASTDAKTSYPSSPVPEILFYKAPWRRRADDKGPLHYLVLK